jgi:hypothetical protein
VLLEKLAPFLVEILTRLVLGALFPHRWSLSGGLDRAGRRGSATLFTSAELHSRA